MVKVYFLLKHGKTKANGEDPIFCRVSLGNESFSLSTSKSISRERWEATMRLNVKLRSEKEKHTKQALEALQLKIEKCYYELSLLQEHVSLIDLRNKITGKEVTQNPTNLLLEVFKKHNEHFEKLVKSNERSAASLQKYKRSHDLVQNFLKAKYGLEDIEVEKVSSSMIYNLESYMKFESVFKDKVGIDNNSVVKYFSNFKSMCNYGIKMELIDKNPFVRYDGKVRVKEAVFLTQEELNGIEKLTLKTPRLERVRDIFLFSCYTGYAPIDACKLTEENIIKDANGNMWIKTNRTKTTIRANVPVLPICKKIIEKYQGKQDTLIPGLSNQKMNSYLKEIADLCKLNKNLTWYVARHTFATTVTLGNGIKIENVSSMLGHSNIKQTQHYAKVLDNSVMEDMSKIMHKFQ